MEVCPLSRGVMLPSLAQFLSVPLQISFRFLHLRLPALLSTCLTARFPWLGEVRAYHVPRSRLGGLGPVYTPVARHLR